MVPEDLLKKTEYTVAKLASLLEVDDHTIRNWKRIGIRNRNTGIRCYLVIRQQGGHDIVDREAYLKFHRAQNRLHEPNKEDP